MSACQVTYEAYFTTVSDCACSTGKPALVCSALMQFSQGMTIIKRPSNNLPQASGCGSKALGYSSWWKTSFLFMCITFNIRFLGDSIKMWPPVNEGLLMAALFQQTYHPTIGAPVPDLYGIFMKYAKGIVFRYYT